MEKKKYTMTLVIPAKNEEGGIAEIIDLSKNLVDEIIVIDGHSTDRTRELALAKGI